MVWSVVGLVGLMLVALGETARRGGGGRGRGCTSKAETLGVLVKDLSHSFFVSFS